MAPAGPLLRAQRPQPTCQRRGLRVVAPLALALLLLTVVAYNAHSAAWRQMIEVPLGELEAAAEDEAPDQEGQQTTAAAGGDVSSDVSRCGATATARGPHQRVVAYSFYGDASDHRAYFQGIARNAAAVGRLYPGWTMRVYHEVPPGGDSPVSRELDTLSREFPHLDLCYVGDIPGYGDLRGRQQNAWRFLAMADPLVDVFVSRDLDALPLPREADAVAEWLQSNATFHVMRDHPAHGVPILAGMWGARPHLRRDALRALAEAVTAQPKGRKDLDQKLLAEHVWPAIRGDVWQHDAYHCGRFRGHGHMRGFPSPRNQTAGYNFVGNRAGIDARPLLRRCPLQCRPPLHRNWHYC